MVEWTYHDAKEARLYDTSAIPPALVGKWIYAEAELGLDAWHWYDAFNDKHGDSMKLPPDFPNPPGDIPMEPTAPVKPGWQTTEFWLTLLGQIMPVLVLLHAIQPADVSTLQGASTQIIQAVFALVTSGGILWSYIAGRAKVKAAKS